MCDGEIDLVAKVERCRQAILEGIRVEFAHPLLPPMPGAGGHKVGPPPPYPMAHPPGRGRGRGGPVRNSVQGEALEEGEIEEGTRIGSCSLTFVFYLIL